MSKTVYIKTFGCQMNKADSRRLEEIFMLNGYVLSEMVWEADVVIYNTCSVREHAEQKAISNIGNLKILKEKNPGLIICIVGCMAQRMQKKLIEKFQYIDFVVSPARLFELPMIIKQNELKIHLNSGMNIKEYYEDLTHIIDKDRSYSGYVPVMRGCNNYCSYCIVPYVRGIEQYRKISDIIKECTQIAEKGINDIMLLGQSVNSHPEFKEILKRISQIDSIKRVRFVTSYPGKMDKDIVNIIRDSDVLCNYFHLPVQSGSDAVLKRMNRKYTIGQFLEIAEYIREQIPQAAISSDFIVGFSGESDDDFKKTLEVVRSVQFDQAFTFKYSPRPGTKAAAFNDDVPLEEKKLRLEELNKLCSEVSLIRNKKLEEEELEIFSEGNNSGRTEHYKLVFWDGEPVKSGCSLRVKIDSALPHSLKGTKI